MTLLVHLGSGNSFNVSARILGEIRGSFLLLEMPMLLC